MADGSLEFYKGGRLTYSLNSRFMNILGSFYIPLNNNGGSFSDSRLTEGEPVAFAVWKPREGYYENEYVSVWRAEPIFSYNGNTISWYFDGGVRTALYSAYMAPRTGGFDVYYGVM